MLKNTLTVFNSRENYKMKFIVINLLLGTFILTLSSCNWNRTEKAQQQIYASGPDAPSAFSEALQRNQDYYKKSDHELLNKMR
tara:strand:- start:105 stop:353 length:249 start_codon:yes stop_codon:yes gene_type:complete